MSELELCTECRAETGRAGRAEDSLYHGDLGPFCEDCFEAMPELWFERAKRLHALNAELVEALAECVTTMEHARVFVNSRERIKQPEGAELYDEALAKARAARARAENGGKS